MRTRFLYKQKVSLLAILAGLFCCMLVTASNAGPTETTDKAIQHLLEYVARSDLTFVRNSGRYTALEASGHMQKKYTHFRDEIATAEQFIELCASRSLLSGKPYLVIDGHGETLTTSEWLTAELKTYRNQLGSFAK